MELNLIEKNKEKKINIIERVTFFSFFFPLKKFNSFSHYEKKKVCNFNSTTK